MSFVDTLWVSDFFSGYLGQSWVGFDILLLKVFSNNVECGMAIIKAFQR
jgi:hypothetical protein